MLLRQIIWDIRGDSILMHIAICDDERSFIVALERMIKRYTDETDQEIKITTYYDGADLIENYDTTIDLIFLDIKMTQVNGLKAAEHIRKADSKVGIIFLTTLSQYGLEGYKYQAVNYIIKPIKYARLKIELDKWLERYGHELSPSLLVANDTGKYKVFLNTLCYIETHKRKVLLHTKTDEISCYKSMRQMEQEMGQQGFVRCHTSFMVNLYFVKGVENLEIELVNGKKIPISQPRRKEFMERLAEYWGDML